MTVHPVAGVATTSAALPPIGHVEQVVRGIYRMLLPVPFKPSHVFVWFLADDDGWTIIDTGSNDATTRAAFEAALRDLGNPRIRDLLVTHAHIDHASAAGWLSRRQQARLLMSRQEWLQARLSSVDQAVAAHCAFFAQAGCPAAWLDEMPQTCAAFSASFAGIPEQYHRLADGDELVIGQRRWTVLTGGGHTPEQIMLHCAEDALLLAADHLLARIYPAIRSSHSEPDTDTLGDAFASLDRLAMLPDQTRVLPSHGEMFTGIHAVVEATRAHHRKRLALVAARLDHGVTAFEALSAIYRREPTFAGMRIPVAELFALLRHLEVTGVARSETDAAGARRFFRA